MPRDIARTDASNLLAQTRITRRQALRALVLGAAAIGVAACSQAPASPAAKPADAPKPTADASKPVGINPVAAPPAPPTAAPAVASKPAEAARPAEAAKPASAVVRGGSLTTAVPNHVVTLDPHNSVNGTDEHVYRHVYDTLVDIDQAGKVLPKLAVSWDIADTAITFKLRPGVKFHDGTDFNADVVKANFDRLLDPNLKMVMRGSMSDIMGAEVVDPMTVKLIMRGPSAPTFAGLAGRGGSIVSPTAVQKFGKDYPLNPVGTGPFVFQEWIKDNKVTLKRSENYWMQAPDGSQLPYLDTLVMRSIIDDSVRLVELQTNNVQIIETVPPKDVATIQSNPALVYFKLDGLPYHYRLNFNTAKPPFDNKILRQAFCWSVNRETMVRVLAFGQGVPSKSVWPAGSWMADPSANAYGYDPEKAKALFKESGVTSLEFPMVVFTRDEDQLLGQMIQAQMQEVGVKLTIDSVERSSGVERYRSSDFQMGIGRFSTEGDPDLQINQFLGKTANNYWTNYDSATFNDLRNKAAGTYDVAQRKAFYTELDKVLLGDAPAVELYKRDWAHALSGKIKGFDTTARGMWVFTSAWLEK